jgi:hypothetical protein
MNRAISNGVPGYYPRLKQTFKVPVPSCLIGYLFPENKILPMSALEGVYFQLYPSLYWLFSSTPSKTLGTSALARSYAITQFMLRVVIIKIADCITDEAIQS